MRTFLFVASLCLFLTPSWSGTEFVRVRDGQFFFYGKTWHPYGAMYRPLYAQPGEEKDAIDWLEKYDPAQIERDLDLMKSLGFNTVRVTSSSFFHEKHADENWSTYPGPEDSYKSRFNDFLDKLGRRGMKAQVFVHFLPKGSPLSPGVFEFMANPEKRTQALGMFRKFITELDLARRPEILSYEVDWEPFCATEGQRNAVRRGGADGALVLWNRWTIDHYGSLEVAEERWGYAEARIKDGDREYVSAPSNEQVMKDGPWTRKCVAYRRFCEDMINKRYALILAAVREVDSNHLVCAQRVLLNGQSEHHSTMIQFPIRHTTAFLDYFGYTLTLMDTWGLFDTEKYLKDDLFFRRQGFGLRYSKFGKPVIYDEYGSSVYWKQFPEETAEHQEQVQKLHYWRMHELAREFGIDGMIAWWWAGRRPMHKGDKEYSDYGIIRSDGTLRPCSQTIKETGSTLYRLGQPYKYDALVMADEFKHSDEWLMYIEGKNRFEELMRDGKKPEVTTPYWGTDSTNCPLTCLCGMRLHKHCPIRALNGVFGEVEAPDSAGRWLLLENGQPLPQGLAHPLKLKITVANTGDASWAAGDEKGSVRIFWRCDKGSGEIPIQQRLGPNAVSVMEFSIPQVKGELVLGLIAGDRTEFGDLFRAKYPSF